MITRPSPAQLEQVVTRVLAVRRTPVILTIDGRSGSGKTTFAAALGDALADTTVVHLDDIYPGWDGLAATPALLAAQVFTPLRRGEPAAFRQFNWQRGEFGDLVSVPTARLVVVEGAGSSAGIAGQYADVRVWLEADEAVRKHRALTRDGDAYRPHWHRWARQESALFGDDHTRDHAHIILVTDCAD